MILCLKIVAKNIALLYCACVWAVVGDMDSEMVVRWRILEAGRAVGLNLGDTGWEDGLHFWCYKLVSR